MDLNEIRNKLIALKVENKSLSTAIRIIADKMVDNLYKITDLEDILNKEKGKEDE